MPIHLSRAFRLLSSRAAKGTAAEGAQMRIEVIAPTLRCKECDTTFLGHGSTLFCPQCLGGRLEELDAEKIDLECDFAE